MAAPLKHTPPSMAATVDPKHLRLWSVAIAVFAIAVALWCMPTTVQAGDAGEFSTVLLAGGVAHPSGYPVMRALGPLARAAHAMGMSPASAAALPCALSGALAIVLLFRALAAHTGCGPAAVASCTLAVSPLYVAHVYDAEVWGPLLAFAAAYLLVFLRAAERPIRPFWLGLLLGLGTAHHLTFVLLTPLAIAAAWPREGVTPISLIKAGAEGLAGSALGLCFTLTLLIGNPDPAAPGWRWGDLSSLDGWLHHVTRGDYGSTELSHHDAQAGVLAQWSRSLGSIGSALGGKLLRGHPLATLAVLAGLFALAWRGALARLRAPARWGFVAALGVTTFWFPTLFDLDPQSPFAAWILERFDLLPALLWTATLAMAMRAVLDRARLRSEMAAAPAILCVLISGVSGLPHRPAADTHLSNYARAVLASAANPDAPHKRSYLLGTDDHRSFPILFTQEVEGVAPEVVYIDPALMRYGFYRQRITTRYPEVPPIPQPAKLVAALQALPGAPDVYLANIMSRKASQLPLVPHGAVYRVLSPAELGAGAPPSTAALAQRHRRALAATGVDVATLRAEFMTSALSGERPLSPWPGDVWGLVIDLDNAMLARPSR